MRELTGSVAIVTGSSDGIGLATARRLGELGAAVVVNSRSQDRADAVAHSLCDDGLRATGVGADLASADGVETLMAGAVAAYGTVDILVNNAGMPSVVPAEELRLEDWRAVLDLNLTAPFLCAQAARRIMLAKGKGVIVNVGSVFSRLGMRGRLATPAEIANAIAFVASDDASFVNATSIYVDGGWTGYGGW